MRNKRVFVVSGVLGIVTVAMLGMVTTVVGQSKPTLQGVYRVSEVKVTGPNARTVTKMSPAVVIIAGRHFSFVMDGSALSVDGTPRPVLPGGDSFKASADQLRASWGPFAAGSGTIEIRDGEFDFHYIAAKGPEQQQSVSTSTYRFEGNAVVWTTLVKNAAGPIANPVSYKWTRLE